MTTQNLTCLSLDNQLAKTGVGERTREGNDLYNEMSEAGVINQKDLKSSKIALVYGQMNEPPGARLRVALSGLAITEYFRDEKKSGRIAFYRQHFQVFTSRCRIRQVVRGHIHCLKGRDRPFLCRRYTLLQRTHLGSERRLISDGACSAAKQR